MWPSDYFESTQLELTKYLAKNHKNRNGGPSDRLSACKEYADASLTDAGFGNSPLARWFCGACGWRDDLNLANSPQSLLVLEKTILPKQTLKHAQMGLYVPQGTLEPNDLS